MLRALLYALTILHLGPGIAFAMLAFGCDGPAAPLGEVCHMGVFASFASLTAWAWLILCSGLAAVLLVQRARRAAWPATGPRIAALLALLATGALIGAAGQWITHGPWGYLAVPAALAAGWLFLANPLACEAQAPPGPHG